jgi:hypothetical protein
MTIDHINPSLKRVIPYAGSALYKYLSKNNYPQGFQVMCQNCNSAKRQELSCPHTVVTRKLLTKSRKRKEKVKKKVFDYYGWECKCCKESNSYFLTIDHIQGGGRKHREEIGKNGLSIYNYLVKKDFPHEYQTLCYNCNWGKYINGNCPHKAASITPAEELDTPKIQVTQYADMGQPRQLYDFES